MPKYEVTDNITGKRYELTGDSPPTEQELEGIFAGQRNLPPEAPAPQAQESYLVKSGKDFIDKLAGTAETAGSLATGLVAQPISYLGGVAMTAAKGGEEGKAFREFLADKYTYAPRTKTGQKNMEVVNLMTKPFGLPRKGGEAVGRAIDTATGNTDMGWEEGLGNVAEAPLQALGVKGLMGSLAKYGAVSKTPSTVKVSEAKINQEIAKVVKEDFYKTVRPSTGGKTNLSSLQKYGNRVGNAEKYIAENKNDLSFVDETTGQVTTGQLPKSALEHVQAWKQSMQSIWQQGNDLVKAKTGTGITVSVSPLIRELKTIIVKNKTASPSVAREAQALIERLEKEPTLSFEQVQEQLGQINSRQAGKATSTYSDYGNMQVDSLHAKFLRNALDKNIEGVKEVRNSYADFKAGEADITKAAARRLNVDPSKMDFLDIGAVAEATLGVLTFNPAAIAIAGTIKGMNWFRKRAKDVDYNTKKMYEKIDAIIQKDAGFGEAFRGGLPKDTTPSKQIEYVPRMGMEDISSVKGLKAKVNNPEWFSKNKDLIETLLEKKIRKPETEAEFNQLFYDIRTRMQGGTTRKDWATKPQKPLSSQTLDKGKSNYKNLMENE